MKKVFLRMFCFVGCCFVCSISSAQTIKIEKLKAAVASSPDQKSKLDALLALCDQWESYSPDSFYTYVIAAKNMASAQRNNAALLQADYYMAAYFFQKNKLDTAEGIIDAGIASLKKTGRYNETYILFNTLKANILLRNGRFNEVLAMDFDLLKETETHEDSLGMFRVRIGIGNVYMKHSKYEESLKWYYSVLNMMRNSFYREKLCYIYNNIAIVFYHLDNEDSCVYYVKKGIEYSEQAENLTNLANSLFLYGGILNGYEKPKEAEPVFQHALEVRKKIGDIYYIIADMAQIGIFYSNTNNPEKGIALCKEGLELASKNGHSFTNVISLYEALSKNYLAAGDYKNYSGSLEKLVSLKDSFFHQNSAEELAKLESKYELQKKENIIMQQNFAITRKNYLFYGALLLSVLIIVIAFLVLNGYQRKQQMKMKQMHEEEKRLVVQAVKEAEEAERKRIAADLHDNLGAYAASIVSNLEFIKPETENQESIVAMQELRNNSQSIVSQLSDTIWALKKDALSLTAISDRIKIFIQRIQASYPRINMYVGEEIVKDAILPPSQAFHLFQLIQEAVNNAVRHSGCTSIHIRVEGFDNWTIKIYDDGTGMMQKKASLSGGNGLQNMRERAAISGWHIEWQSNNPRGTQVVIASSQLGQVLSELQ